MLPAHLFHSAGAAGAAMNSVEGAGRRYREQRCREPYVHEWILQRARMLLLNAAMQGSVAR